jgi:hypothetical protein
VLAKCFWLLLASLLLQQPARQSLSTDGAPSISNHIVSEQVARPQHASVFARAVYSDRSSADDDAGPDSFDATVLRWPAGRDTHASYPAPIAIASLPDFLSRRTAHPRAPPA